MNRVSQVLLRSTLSLPAPRLSLSPCRGEGSRERGRRFFLKHNAHDDHNAIAEFRVFQDAKQPVIPSASEGSPCFLMRSLGFARDDKRLNDRYGEENPVTKIRRNEEDRGISCTGVVSVVRVVFQNPPPHPIAGGEGRKAALSC